MGLLQLPRIYFKGFNYWTPSTYNNNDYSPPINTYETGNARPNWDYLHGQGVYNNEEFKKWSIIPLPTDNAKGQIDPKAKVPPAEWGYYGGQQSGFVTQNAPIIANPDFPKPQDFTHVTGFTNNQGEYYNTKDAWMNQPLQMNLNTGSPAKLVDINPQSFWSSQVFLNNVTLGDKKSGFTADSNNRMYSRWINPGHNYNTTDELIIAGNFSAVFQTCFNKNTVKFFGKGSSMQQELEEALKSRSVLGLMMRFTSYYTIYFQGKVFKSIHKKDPSNLYKYMGKIAKLYQEYDRQVEAYSKGKLKKAPLRPINSAYSALIGWVGLCTRDDLKSTPGGRFLIPYSASGSSYTVEAKGLPKRYYLKDKDGKSPSQTSLGPAAFEVKYNRTKVDRISIDFSSAMPLLDSSGKKADFGKVKLAYINPQDSKPVDIAELPNNQPFYEKFSGIIDIYFGTKHANLNVDQIQVLKQDLTKADIVNTQLAILVKTYVQSSTKKESARFDDPRLNDLKAGQEPVGKEKPKRQEKEVVGLLETPLVAQTDQRGVYAEEPNPSWNRRAKMSTADIKVTYFGGLPPEGTTLSLSQSNEQLSPVSGSDALVDCFYKDGRIFHPYTEAIPVKRGRVTIAFKALKPGMPNIAFEPSLPNGSYSGAPFNPPGIASAFYTVVRCLPFQNAMADEFEEWLKTHPDVRQMNKRVFSDVFGTYHLMYPVMDFISSPLKFQEWRGRILALTDPAFFESAKYMPVTRSLSAGQRRILELWNQYLDGAPTGPAATRTEETPGLSFDGFSRT